MSGDATQPVPSIDLRTGSELAEGMDENFCHEFNGWHEFSDH